MLHLRLTLKVCTKRQFSKLLSSLLYRYAMISSYGPYLLCIKEGLLADQKATVGTYKFIFYGSVQWWYLGNVVDCQKPIQIVHFQVDICLKWALPFCPWWTEKSSEKIIDCGHSTEENVILEPEILSLFGLEAKILS